jgi:hypothetical protein
MTVTTTVAQAVAYAHQAEAVLRWDVAAASWQEAIDNSNKSLGSTNAATLATYAASRDAAKLKSHQAGAF